MRKIEESDHLRLQGRLWFQVMTCYSSVYNASCSGRSLSLFRQKIASFEDESIESLEKQDIIFKLISHVLGKVNVESKLHDQMSSIARRKLQSMSAFLKKLA
ncbi:unnamed protein product [Eruca vesicaria subsp. sativa]|uniref:PI4-kinase N-terminal domain-containing protein n=1 Tax=Eruca vesicaria subsp. sativa TaxID=29727 RepID=A0ABC8KGM7_ERUVS|nr:unnamed protein product [Eruca vesicaria subsp. sativa]